VHPDFVMIDRNGKVVAGREEGKVIAAQVQRDGLLGLYPQTSKLRTWEIASVESMLLESTPELEDTLPEWLRQEADLPSLWEAYHAIHYPHSVAEADRGAERLIWEEAIATQVTMAVRRRSAERHDAPVCSRRDGGLLAAFEDRLPFTPTVGQDEVS
ncbi:ATP-dependent DNA helicase RecG, partial [Salmonella enterica subsp. enterica serovar Derby]